ncbi:xanthine dehydrogenase YagR molybdenum-binding subunit [Streptomyces sp. WMMB 714]|uniref:xanthine dehydrogenase family protein molybdopterin-binding subunit n=1 Tax=Streptomyces sp. WMMB 714 TaxID=1286822 RepID=UPI0005F7C0B7|nr:xanthine dehydrogenase family protein molybdopterin-binding subunit [Streptomyces sp. WMMB 714]SCK43364.1 xanthine dehydrogenase YagR molybdenum-binding subunit [Streptomyces sp. WMMB 714]
MSLVEPAPLVGAGIDRVDGALKAAGAAAYPSDVNVPGQVHAALVQSTVASGRIRSLDTLAAEAAPGVLRVITHRGMPRLPDGPMTALGASPPAPLQDDRVLHHGQHVAMVVAETPEEAVAAARLVEVEYEPGDAVTRLDDPRARLVENPWGLDSDRGSVAEALDTADVKVSATYTTPDNTNNPLGLFATVAVWEGDKLTVHDTTQWPSMARATFAKVFGLPESSVRVLAPYVGGAFGNGLRVWPHVILTVLAARMVKRPVKIVLTRPQMFCSIGHRPSSIQHVTLGADRSGALVAVEHRATSSVAMEDDDYEPVAASSAVSYACANVLTRDVQARLNIPDPTSMRAPAEGQGNFALESALDELAFALKTDPLELRLRNYAEIHPGNGLPWTSKALRECYRAGAERFGWSRRDPEPRSMRDGDWLVGYGMAGVSYPWYAQPCNARATVNRDGSAFVRSAATDIGTGTYTVMTQVSADALGIPLARVRFDLGDSDMPVSPQAGGSGLTGALATAVRDACERVVQQVLDLVGEDGESPLRGCSPEDVVVADGRLHRRGRPDQGESYADILGRHGKEELTADGASSPADPSTLGMAPAGAFGAKFVEVRVDADLGIIRVARVVSAIDGGRILNEKTARSQIIGGTVGGIGQALFEETATDSGTGRIANATLGDYLVPVNADVGDMDVVFVGEPDRATPIGTKGVGEVGLVGIAAAIANAVHHATGKRVRSLPITLDDLL